MGLLLIGWGSSFASQVLTTVFSRFSCALLFAQRTCDGAASLCGARTGNRLLQRGIHPTGPGCPLRPLRMGFAANFGAKSYLFPRTFRPQRRKTVARSSLFRLTKKGHARATTGGVLRLRGSSRHSQTTFMGTRGTAQRSSKLKYGRHRPLGRTPKHAPRLHMLCRHPRLAWSSWGP